MYILPNEDAIGSAVGFVVVIFVSSIVVVPSVYGYQNEIQWKNKIQIILYSKDIRWK